LYVNVKKAKALLSKVENFFLSDFLDTVRWPASHFLGESTLKLKSDFEQELLNRCFASNLFHFTPTSKETFFEEQFIGKMLFRKKRNMSMFRKHLVTAERELKRAETSFLRLLIIRLFFNFKFVEGSSYMRKSARSTRKLNSYLYSAFGRVFKIDEKRNNKSNLDSLRKKKR